MIVLPGDIGPGVAASGARYAVGVGQRTRIAAARTGAERAGYRVIVIVRQKQRVAADADADRVVEGPALGPGGAAVGPVPSADLGAPETVDADRQAAAPDLAAPQGAGILDGAALLARPLRAGPGDRAVDIAPQHDVDRANATAGMQRRGAVADKFDPFDGRGRQRIQGQGGAPVDHDDRSGHLGPVHAEIVVCVQARHQIRDGRRAGPLDFMPGYDTDRPHAPVRTGNVAGHGHPLIRRFGLGRSGDRGRRGDERRCQEPPGRRAAGPSQMRRNAVTTPEYLSVLHVEALLEQRLQPHRGHSAESNQPR